MATKKTTTKTTSGKPRKRSTGPKIESLLAGMITAQPPDSEKDLARWVLGRMLAEMVTKLVNGEEIKFGSSDILRVIQTMREYEEEEEKRRVSGIKVEWVEPEKG